ncbi:TRAP transporter TatT component family protein [Oceanispirochaeta sp.]|jgi:predicted anti-sigma-YlaC factor YlaD|uniref:TRAP transporter TatT component family protein n=1 Tax=Oceanispirochaeta sp. TaxID=2035350 RepID=UPI00261A578A|nr:TRAP transporter TatT component family protein [Oceanispirochaeta sp.]MDA3955162.1 TRAP transporter TatT component family protein [Oceanispirochaeta sp.]
MKKWIHFSILIIGSSLFLVSCRSVEKMTISKLSDMLSSDSGAGAFTRDDDPQLIADAMPFTLKMYELLMDLNPDDSALRLAAGKAFIMYANGFIQTPSTMLDDDDFEVQIEMLQRAGKMYLRGRNYVLDSLYLEIRDGEELLKHNLDGFLEECNQKVAPQLYWAAAGWLGAFSCDPFDFEIGRDIQKPVAFLYRALELNEEYEDGSIHDLLLTLWSTLPRSIIDKALLDTPESSGAFALKYYERFNIPQDEESRARFHFSRAIALSDGKNPGTYISLALAYPVKEQDYKEFERLLQKALALDPYDDPDTELMVIIYQQRAAWLLENRDDYFLIDF